MNKEKLLYEAPTAQTLVVRFESRILTGSNEGLTDDPMSGVFGEDD